MGSLLTSWRANGPVVREFSKTPFLAGIGIGTNFVHHALARGASKVYATARNPRNWDDERVVPLTLDVTDPPPSRRQPRPLRTSLC
jgi:hypothetical protein